MLRLGLTIALLTAQIAICSFAADLAADLPKRAVERSQITLPGSQAFVLKAKVLEATNPSNTDYHAEIEEYWVAPDKWRRTVKTSIFSETLIVNGDKTSEQITGDYYPNWLRTIVASIFDPGNPLQGVDLSRSSDNPEPFGPAHCRRLTHVAGIAPVSNQVFSTFCFKNDLLESVGMPGYNVSYRNYKNFAGKRVAHTIGEYLESGTELEATIEELKELKAPDEVQLAIQEPSAPLKTTRVSEETLRSLALNAPDIVWPTIRSGADTGTLSLYACLDRSGNVREVYELNSSNPGLSDAVRDQVMKWKFKTTANEGSPVQVEALLTFAFHTATADPIPVLEEEEGSKLILHRVEPTWPEGFAPAGTPIIVTIGVNENGDYKGLVFVTSDDSHRMLVIRQLARVEEPLKKVLEQWKFKPYVRNGKATEYQLKVTFWVNGYPALPVT